MIYLERRMLFCIGSNENPICAGPTNLLGFNQVVPAPRDSIRFFGLISDTLVICVLIREGLDPHSTGKSLTSAEAAWCREGWEKPLGWQSKGRTVP
jgi:hypothetical protein